MLSIRRGVRLPRTSHVAGDRWRPELGGSEGSRFCSAGRPVIQRSTSGTIDLLTCNLRHMFNSVNLRILNVVYPKTWDPHAFRDGTAEAYKQVNALLDEGDFLILRELLSEELLDDLKECHAGLAEGVDYKLLEVRQLGIFRSSARADELGNEAVFVTPLLRVREKYVLSKDSTYWWEVQRLHKWTFKRILPGEYGSDASEWQIVAMDKKRWRPPGLDEWKPADKE